MSAQGIANNRNEKGVCVIGFMEQLQLPTQSDTVTSLCRASLALDLKQTEPLRLVSGGYLADVCPWKRVLRRVKHLLAHFTGTLRLRDAEVATHETDRRFMQVANEVLDLHQNL